MKSQLSNVACSIVLMICFCVPSAAAYVAPSTGTATPQIRFAADGRSVVFLGPDNEIAVWNLTTGAIDKVISAESVVREDHLSLPDDPGRALVNDGWADKEWLAIYDLSTGEPVWKSAGMEIGSVGDSIAISRDGSHVAIVENDLISLWAPPAKEPVWQRTSADSVSAVGFTPDGKSMVAVGWNGVQLRELTKGDILASSGHNLEFIPDLVEISRDGNAVAASLSAETAYVTFHADRIGTEKPVREDVPKLSCIALAPKGDRLVLGYESGKIATLRIGKSPRHLIAEAHKGKVASIAFSPNGKLIASGGDDGIARIWNAATGALLASAVVNDESTWAVWTSDYSFIGTPGFAPSFFSQDGISKSVREKFQDKLADPKKVAQRFHRFVSE
jgi:hypothetical protein